MSFITNKKILRLSNLSNMIASHGAAIAIAVFGGFTLPAIIAAALFGGWLISNGYLARRILKDLPEDADPVSLWRVHAKPVALSEAD